MKNLAELIGWDSSLETKNRFTYIINAFSIGLVSLFQIFYIIYVKEPLIISITFLCLADLFIVFIFLKKKKFNIAKVVMIFGFLFQEFSLVFLWFPREANFNYFFFIVAPISFFIYDFDIRLERVSLVITNIIAILLLMLSELITITPPYVTLTPSLAKFFTILSLTSTISSITIVFYFYARSLSAINNELRVLANTDVLTKILNRRSFNNEGNMLFDFSKKYGKIFALIILDIDYFKNVNDTYGHPAGDEVLVQMSELLSASLRENDTIARYGGEEFALLLRGSKPDGLLKAAEHLRKAVDTHHFEISDGQKIRITISLGIVIFSDKSESFEEMIREADKALYRAKDGGRNRLVAG